MEAGGLEMICERIANGETMVKIAADFGENRDLLGNWLYSTPEGREMATRARARSANALAEQALTIADKGTTENAPKTRLQVETRRWLASKYDAAVYGDTRGPTVQINIGQLHIDALRQHRTIDVAAAPVLESDLDPDTLLGLD